MIPFLLPGSPMRKVSINWPFHEYRDDVIFSLTRCTAVDGIHTIFNTLSAWVPQLVDSISQHLPNISVLSVHNSMPPGILPGLSFEEVRAHFFVGRVFARCIDYFLTVSRRYPTLSSSFSKVRGSYILWIHYPVGGTR